MSNCIDKLMCDASSGCDVIITGQNGEEVDVRYLHDGDWIYISVEGREGYIFDGFFFEPIGGKPYRVSAELQPDGRYKLKAICGGTFVANYSVLTYKVRVIPYPDDGVHGTVSGTGTYPYGQAITISATEFNGYHFVGWYINNELLSDQTTYQYTVTQNVYIVGKFVGDQYSVLAKPNSRLLGETEGSGVYEYGTDVTLRAIPYEGSYLVEWDDGETENEKPITVVSNALYIANFARYRYTVTVILVGPNGDERETSFGMVTGAGTYEHGTIVTLKAIASMGYEFVSWSDGVDDPFTDIEFSFAITQDVTYTATFSVMMCTLQLKPSPFDGGIIQRSGSDGLFTGGTYPYGTEIYVKASPNRHYEFTNWTDGTNTDIRRFVLTDNITQTAYFIKNRIPRTLRIHFDSTQGNVKLFTQIENVSQYSLDYVHATVQENTRLLVLISPRDGFCFDGWDDDRQAKTTSRPFIMDNDIERTVYFAQMQTHEICVCSNERFNYSHGYFEVNHSGGTVIIDSNFGDRCVTIVDGEQITVTFVPTDPMYEVVSWDTTQMNDMECVIDGDTVTVNVIEDGILCATIMETRSRIGVQNSPSDILDGIVDFTIDYEGGGNEILTPTDNTRYTNAFESLRNPVEYTLSVNTPNVEGYHFVGISGTNGIKTDGETTLTTRLNDNVVYTCVYEEDGCTANFTFDIQDVANVTFNGGLVRNDMVSPIAPNITFSVTADNGYTVTDVVDVTSGESIGSGRYHYQPFPFICDKGTVSYYSVMKPYDFTDRIEFTTIYDRKYNLTPDSPEYVRLVRAGMDDVYAKLVTVDLNNETYYDAARFDVVDSEFYNTVKYPAGEIQAQLSNASADSPFMIYDETSGSLFVKVVSDCRYNAECGREYRICVREGEYESPEMAWYPLYQLPDTVLDRQVYRPEPYYLNLVYFTYDNNPADLLAQGYTYCEANINNQRVALRITDIR